MKYRFIFILSAFTLFSCKGDKDSLPTTYYISISGVVSDQVTNKPVQGATVSTGIQKGVMPGDGLVSPASSMVTGPDGKYQLSSKTLSVKDISQVPIGERGNSIAIIAVKAGYAGSNREEIYYLNAQNTVKDLMLYHSTQLNLHIRNDTENNNVNEVCIKLNKYRTSNQLTVFSIVLRKEKLDTIINFNTLWANWPYKILVLKPDGTEFSPKIEYSMTPVPDIINTYDVFY